MAFFDLPLERLREYRPEVRRPDDFDDFWHETITRELARPLDVRVERVDTPLSTVEVHDLSWVGHGGHRVRGWLRLPVGTGGPLPTVVQYHGYAGGRGYPHGNLLHSAAGYAHFALEARGQGWQVPAPTPATPDAGPSLGEVHVPGMMTRGVLDHHDYYYLRVFVDALRLLQLAHEHDRVDSTRIALSGTSQGGGMTIAVAGLAAMAGLPVHAAVAAVPFLCHFERAVGLTDSYPYKELVDFLQGNPQWADRVFQTLSYFDGVHFAAHATAPTLFATGLMDTVCPPSTVFAAFNAWAHEDREIEVYPWNGHEGGRDHFTWRALHWLREHDV
ncbi:acetylxylan esterase [uncultured Tessaracoccus sp.]|uniref:acetylxylan esterase n=1 Tax=uncultured Tessaracoccus sp. TaxID=905023 RepID=UPI0025E94151|nr:acetylxylan esterase [uncultured Tessaracoccus sp.]